MKKLISTVFTVFPHLEQTSISYEECLARYEGKREESNEFLVCVQRPYMTGFEPSYNVPAEYHLFDFSFNKGLRGTHLVIETLPWMRETINAKALIFRTSNLLPIEVMKNFTTHDSETLSQALQKIETKVILENEFEFPLLSKRVEYYFYFYGLMFELNKLIGK